MKMRLIRTDNTSGAIWETKEDITYCIYCGFPECIGIVVKAIQYMHLIHHITLEN